MWAVIGGSGFEKFDNFEIINEMEFSTPFGKPSAPIVRARIDQTELLFLSRHGKNHEFTPSGINYRANIFALKKAGASKLLSISAVGSLQSELKPGDCVVPTSYIDRTKSLREYTFCMQGLVSHVSLAQPVDEMLLNTAKTILIPDNYTIHYGKTYICMEGPAFSTKAEARMYRLWGADIIGMTNFPEYALAREAGLYYLPLSFVTDYDCWDDAIAHVTVEEVIKLMRENNHKAFKLIEQLLPQTNHLFTTGCSDIGLKSGLLTPMDKLPGEVKQWVDVLCA